MKTRSISRYTQEFDDSSLVEEGEDPVEILYEDGPKYMFLTVNTKKYPRNFESIESKSASIESVVRAENEELGSLVGHAVKNNREHRLFHQIASNFYNDKERSSEIYFEMQNVYVERLSNKMRGIYENETISKDCAKKTIIESIRTYGSENHSYDHGIFIEKRSLTP